MAGLDPLKVRSRQLIRLQFFHLLTLVHRPSMVGRIVAVEPAIRPARTKGDAAMSTASNDYAKRLARP